jgi:hypothetical protein
MKFGTVLLIGLTALQPGLPRHSAEGAKAGAVRPDGRAVADAAGPFNALGATLFWGAWAYKFDRSRLERNLKVLSAAGVDYVRVLGSVGGASWEDRQTDPRWPDYDAIIAGMTDLAYDRYGLRVQWTVFGGAPFTPAGAERQALVDRFASLAKGRERPCRAQLAEERNGLRDVRGLGRRCDDAPLRAWIRPRGSAAAVTAAVEFSFRLRSRVSWAAAIGCLQQRADRA